MLVQTLEASSGSLTSGIIFYKTIDDYELQIDTLEKKFYRPTSFRIINTTGEQVKVLPIAPKEYEAYQDDSSITDLLPVNNNDTLVLSGISNTFEEVSGVLIQGTGTHTGSLYIYVVKE